AVSGDGPVLELGIGTGRIARPLVRRGVTVFGIEQSPAMVARLHEQPDARDIDVTIGDYTETVIDRRFTLAYLVRNTITNVTTQAAQVACFRNVAAQLQPGGMFVIENYVPELRRLPPGVTNHVFKSDADHFAYESYDDFPNQIAVSHHVWT